MDFSEPTINEDDDIFFDALDEFPISDCPVVLTDQSEPSTSSSNLSHTVPVTDLSETPPNRKPSSELRCRLSSRRDIYAIDSSLNSSLGSTNEAKKPGYRERKYKIYRNLNKNENDSTQVRANSVLISNKEGSTITTVNDESVALSVDSVAEHGDASSNFLVFIAGLVIKAIGFQINLFISFVTFPIWFMYRSYMFMIDPLGTLGFGKAYLLGKLLKLWGIFCENISPTLHEWLKDHKPFWKIVFRCGWGFLWALYVGFILCGLLFSSFVISGLVMRYVVEKPVQMKEILIFDYTKHSPVAYLPIVSCAGASCGGNCGENLEIQKSLGLRFIPPRHKMQVTISLSLPESEYNRNLGVFQVRVDFLSASGKTLASASHPTMLQFKSKPIRLLLTFLKIAPLVTGYSSETQTLNLKIRGFTEGDTPTACLKVTMEQRAEYSPGAGIPEIYDASLILESELPLVKRIIWYWKKTIFIWMGIMFFITELLFALICCRPIIIPRSRIRDGSAGDSSISPDNPPAQT